MHRWIRKRLTCRLAAFCVAAVLTACQAGGSCELVKVAEVPLEPVARRFVVTATINGHPARLLLDTGGQISFVSERAVQRLGMIRDARFNTAVMGLGGGSMQAFVNVDSMNLGDLTLSVDRLAVSGYTENSAIDGVMGLDILRRFDLDIDATGRKLSLYRVRWCDPADPPWNEHTALISGASTMSGWFEIPIEIDGVAGTAAVDTGASSTLITPPMADRLGLTDQAFAHDRTVQVRAIGKEITAHMHRFHTLRIGGTASLHDIDLVVLAQVPPTLAGGSRQFREVVIGQDVLGNRRVWLSYRTGRLYLGEATPRH